MSLKIIYTVKSYYSFKPNHYEHLTILRNVSFDKSHLYHYIIARGLSVIAFWLNSAIKGKKECIRNKQTTDN